MLQFLPFRMDSLTVPLDHGIYFFRLISYPFARCLAAPVFKAQPTPLGFPIPASWYCLPVELLSTGFLITVSGFLCLVKAFDSGRGRRELRQTIYIAVRTTNGLIALTLEN